MNKLEEKLNEGFSIEREDLEERIAYSLSDNHKDVTKIIPLKKIEVITDLTFMKKGLLDSLIRNIPLRPKNNQNYNNLILPYNESEIKVFGVEPKGLKVGQTFVSKDKILGIMGSLENISEAFITKGVSKMPPAQFYGHDKSGNKVMAIYMPPIVESHNGNYVLIDGMHRSYICASAGTTVLGVHINNISSQLPFEEIPWAKVNLMSEKPPINKIIISLNMN